MRLGIARRPRRRRPGLVFVQSAPLVPLSAENGVRCIRVALHCAARILFWLKCRFMAMVRCPRDGFDAASIGGACEALEKPADMLGYTDQRRLFVGI